jgi:2-dehydro-3-deoxygluconokinase
MESSIPDVVTVGEAMALLMARESGPLASVGAFDRATAGAELNVAVGLARLGFQVGYVSSLGADSLARNLLEFMAAEGIDVRHVRVDGRYPTGFMLKSLASDGSDPEVEYFRRGSAASHMSIEDIPQGPYRQARLLHLTGISPALSTGCRDMVFAMAEQASHAGHLVTFDPNLRPRLWPTQSAMIDTVNALASLADVVMPGLGEGKLLTGRDSAEDIAAFYLERGVKQVVVKLGPEGAYYTDGTTSGIAAGLKVDKVVDTVGAGDGFAVGVISALLDKLPLQAAAARGNAIGARVVQYRGDCEGLPTRAQLAG